MLIFALLGWGSAGIINRLADEWIGPRVCGSCGWRLRPVWPVIIAYLRYRGRCPACGKGLPLRPLIIELVTPVLFVLTAARFGLSVRAGVTALYLAILLLISAIDLVTRRIPNIIVLPASGLALLLAFLGAHPGRGSSIVGGIVGFSFFALIFLVGTIFLRIVGRRSKGNGPALGMGDVRLALFIGLATGYPDVNLALVVGTLAGGVGALAIILRQVVRRTYHPLAAMAYGPYLAIGAAVALLR
jgi:leader peptidase (prepilin peptidase)/N-methyltransferase